ncbi:MAG: YhbY family RNA-binding protein [Peptostreptococcaceae bacterium]|nr:YhbY family RNA-binding protein [Peptostreptococcaceae bacterium]
MLTSKQRAYLRSLANSIKPTTVIGKEGVTPALLQAIEETFNTRELIKINLLDSSGLSGRETVDIIAKELRAEPVQSIGNKVVLYRKFIKDPVIILPKK